MKLIVGLVVLVTLFACYDTALGEKIRRERHLFVAVAEDSLGLATTLKIKGFKVHGFYGDLVVASSKKPKLVAQAETIKQMTNIGKFDRSLSYFVLERQEKQYAAPIKVDEDLVTVMYPSFNRVIVSVRAANADAMTADIDVVSADHLEILPIDFKEKLYIGIRKELRPMVAQVYANATARYTLAPDPIVQKLVSQVSPVTLKALVTYLTGEDPSSNILTRNAFSQGAKDAAVWIGQHFKNYGLAVSNQVFKADNSANVIGIKTGVTDPSKIVVVCAHYDSRGTSPTSPTQRAPGANDNGSGTGAILQIAQIFATATFDYTIHFVAFSGEEQGLYGSAAYAQKLVADKAEVVGVLNADMVAYRAPGEKTQCAFPSRYSTPDVESVAKAATTVYVPELTIGVTNACCSDHQSFFTRGIPATGFFERNGGIADVEYHKSGDLVNRPNYDIEGQYTQLTKAICASVAVLAGAK